MKRLRLKTITVLAIAFLAAMSLSSCGEEKESADQGPVSESPDTSVESNQESETDSEPTPLEDDTSSSSAWMFGTKLLRLTPLEFFWVVELLSSL